MQFRQSSDGFTNLFKECSSQTRLKIAAVAGLEREENAREKAGKRQKGLGTWQSISLPLTFEPINMPVENGTSVTISAISEVLNTPKNAY